MWEHGMRVPISRDELAFVRLRIYGSAGDREMDALLDTGAFFVTIPPDDAIALGYDLASAPRVRVTTANGVIQAPQIVLSRVQLGTFEEADVPAVCIQIPGGRISSLLGWSLLSRFNIAIEFKQQTLTIADP
jgi:clan AA aspartic protease (TIGR02281 family)